MVRFKVSLLNRKFPLRGQPSTFLTQAVSDIQLTIDKAQEFSPLVAQELPPQTTQYTRLPSLWSQSPAETSVTRYAAQPELR